MNDPNRLYKSIHHDEKTEKIEIGNSKTNCGFAKPVLQKLRLTSFFLENHFSVLARKKDEEKKIQIEVLNSYFYDVKAFFTDPTGIRTSLTYLWWFGFRLEQIFTTVPVVSKNNSYLKGGQK